MDRPWFALQHLVTALETQCSVDLKADRAHGAALGETAGEVRVSPGEETGGPVHPQPVNHVEELRLAQQVRVAVAATVIVVVELPEFLGPHRNKGTIVLYSNGMTHPAQARDALARLGFTNAYLLTDGLQGFMQTVLKPVSLREVPLTASEAAKVDAWRAFFLGNAPAPAASQPTGVPRLVETG